MSTDYKFEGWAGFDKDSVKGNLKFIEYEPKKWNEDDIDVKIIYAGICHSDISTLSGGWGDLGKMYPQVVGHEIVGEVVRVGSKTENGIKMGDMVGIGAQSDSCLECVNCKDQREQYCLEGQVGTYAGIYKRGDGKGSKSYGGYAKYWRGPSHFAIRVPDNLDPAVVAPMMCGGTTLFSPLQQYGAGKTAKNVGIVGVGGLGHFGILFAKAMGADVTVISHSAHKKDDAIKLGASHFLMTGDKPEEALKEHKGTLDLIVCTSNAADMPIAAYLSLLRHGGHFVLVGAPENNAALKIQPFQLIMSNVHVTGSAIGSPAIIKDMLKFAGDHDVKPWIQKYSMDKVNEAVPAMVANKARYRFVLVNEEHGGKL